MINVPYQELPPAKRRRLMFRTALRSLLFTTVLVVLYYVLTLDERLNAGVAVRLLIGFLAFAGAGAAGGRAPWSATRIGYRWRSHLGGRLSQPGFTHVG